MNYLITAAGLGSRFLKESIKPPKPLIKVKGMELLLWSLKSFEFKPKDNLYIVSLKRDKVKEILLKKVPANPLRKDLQLIIRNTAKISNFEKKLLE